MIKILGYFNAKLNRNEIVPTTIKASTDKDGNAHYQIEGRGIEMIELTVGIVKGICSKSSLDIDEFCEILKAEYKIKKVKEKDDHDKGLNLFNKMFNDLN